MSRNDSSSSANSRKCHKKERWNELCSDGEDRISKLPDAILGDILSSFSTKEAVRTSILSNRWRYVWTFVPCIDIDDSSNLSVYKNDEEKACFEEFVDRVLRLNNVSGLQKCDLVCREHYECFCEWIRALTSRDLEELCVQNFAVFDSEFQPRIELPPSLFTCKKLVSLKLTNHLVLNVPITVCLPNLKILHLVLVQFFDDNSMKNLLAGCPVLEELDMDRDCDDNVTTLCIQSSSLKSFRLEIEESSPDDILGIVLDTKYLERLNICDYVTEQFDVSRLSSLVSVQLDLHCDYLESAGKTNVYMELLSKMCSTKCLKLSFLTMKSLELTTLDNLPVFHNLTQLVVGIMGSSWPVLPYLLECLPNLITFDFSLESTGYLDEVRFRAPKCLMLHLESINIRGFDWSQNEIELIGYFLKNSMVLKKLSIYDANNESNLCNVIFMLPKASTACRIEIFS